MIIYKATNKINNKAYIGFTQDLSIRQYSHLYDANNGSEYAFHRAIRKYGNDAFSWEILDECKTRKEAGKMETQLIAEHDTFQSGYNSTTGGESAWTHSDEAKAKMSEARKGTVYSKETIQRLSAAKKGKILSETHKKNISKGNKGRVCREETKRKISATKTGVATNRITAGAFTKGNVPWNKGTGTQRKLECTKT